MGLLSAPMSMLGAAVREPWNQCARLWMDSVWHLRRLVTLLAMESTALLSAQMSMLGAAVREQKNQCARLWMDSVWDLQPWVVSDAPRNLSRQVMQPAWWFEFAIF